MEQLIHDLLSYSRTIHADEQDVEQADLNESLGQALEALGTSVAESGASIRAGSLPVVSADTAQIALVFQNLISNSIKYRKEGVAPQVVVLCEVRNGHAHISVRDNGIGFQQRYAQQIFGLFRRLHKHEYPGTGLGLAICQRIVQRYGGQIRAEGEPGRGATFTFNLPLATGTEQAYVPALPPIMK
jgi:light-regulated signal transduction histidine kinase (bacteriophytochrome)